MSHSYTKQIVMLDSSSGASSNRTSNAALVADAATISASWVTQAAVASILTVQGSDDDGFFSAIQNWSSLGTIAAAGLLQITAGPRWVRFIRPAVDSQSSVIIQYRSQ